MPPLPGELKRYSKFEQWAKAVAKRPAPRDALVWCVRHSVAHRAARRRDDTMDFSTGAHRAAPPSGQDTQVCGLSFQVAHLQCALTSHRVFTRRPSLPPFAGERSTPPTSLTRCRRSTAAAASGRASDPQQRTAAAPLHPLKNPTSAGTAARRRPGRSSSSLARVPCKTATCQCHQSPQQAARSHLHLRVPQHLSQRPGV